MLTTLLAAVIVLGPVIVIHELGHFLVAKLSGIYVKTFSVGFGPKLLRLTIGETQYALSAIPLGGYVRMAGESGAERTASAPDAPGAHLVDVAPAEKASGEAALYPRDEVSDDDIPPHRWFRNKPIPTRLAVVTAGPIANLVLALVVMTSVLWHEGMAIAPTTVIAGVTDTSEEFKAGLRNDDKVIAVAGAPVTNSLEVETALAAREAGPLELRIERAGRDTTLVLAGVRREKAAIVFPRWSYRFDSRIGHVKQEGPAARAGILPGDRIVEIDGQPIRYYDEISDHINPNIGKAVSVTWERNGERRTASLTPEAEEVQASKNSNDIKKIGRIQIELFTLTAPVSLGRAFSESVQRTWAFSSDTLHFLGQLVTGHGSRDAVGGPIRIGQVAGSALRWGYSTLFTFMAFFSVNLFLLNLLPIPVLDGGHVVFLLVEAVRGEALSLRVQDLLLKVGVSALIAIMGYVVVLDFWRVLHG